LLLADFLRATTDGVTKDGAVILLRLFAVAGDS